MIKVKDSDEFGRLVAALADDVVSAAIHQRMHRDLIIAMKAHPLVQQQSRAFWDLTLRAHANTALNRLCRAFDQEQSSLHLLSWLLTIKDNLHLFSVDEFRKRLADNPFVASLAEFAEKPNAQQLEQDIELCRATDPLVRKLVALRGSNHAHRSAKLAVAGKVIPAGMAMSPEEEEILFDRALTILNRYVYLFSASAYSPRIVGADDFNFVFKCVQEAVEESRERFDAAVRRSDG